MRVLPEATRAHRTESGVEILPWQIMHMMEADAKLEEASAAIARLVRS